MEKGFTLLELLVTLALTSVIVVGLHAVFSTATDVTQSVERHLDANQPSRIVFGVLHDDLEAVAYSSAGDEDFAFGEVDDALLSYCTTTSLALGEDVSSHSGLQKVQHVLKGRSTGGGFTWMRRERPYCGLSGDWEWKEIVLVEHVKDMEMEYLDSQGAGRSDFSAQLDDERIPAAVKVSFTLVEGEERHEEFVIPVAGFDVSVRK